MQKMDTRPMLLSAPLELEEEGLLSGPEEPLEPIRYHKFQAVNPVRDLNWRLRRATWLARRKRDGDPRYDDAETLRALRYQLAKRDGNAEEGFTDIELAEQIHKEDRVTRLEIQARLLARQTPQQIAEHVGLPAAAVAAYEALFFHVCDRLTATDWIVKRAIKGMFFSTARESRTDMFVKTLSFFGGVHVLDIVLPLLLHNSGPLAAPLELDTVEGRTAEKARLTLLVQSLLSDARIDRRLVAVYPYLRQLLRPVPKPVVRGVGSGLMGPLPGSLARSLSKEVADHTPRRLEAPQVAQGSVRQTAALMEVA